MTQVSMRDGAEDATTTKAGSVFGLRLGELGWFASLLMGTAAGFAAFFLGTFCGIFGILIYNGVTHGGGHAPVDFAMSYRRVGFPLGLAVLVTAYSVLGTLWVRRMVRKGARA